MFIKQTKLEYPIDVTDVSIFQTHIRLEDGENEDYLADTIKAATRFVENYIQNDIALTLNTVEISDGVPNPLMISKGNLYEITNVINKDSSTLITDYKLRQEQDWFQLTFTNSYDNIELQFKTGFEKDEVDVMLKRLILIKVEDLYTLERGSYNEQRHNKNAAFEMAASSYKSMAT